jgi:mannose/fructose/N-acetylgalactosamine-specific phosphotransferase system component IIC
MPVFNLHIILAVLGVALAGGIIGLDKTAAGQFMISQPIVAGPLTGWMLGEPTAGIIIGAALELIWVLDMPVGTFVPADATIGTISATAIVALAAPSGASLPLIGFSILLSTGMVKLTRKADGLVRTWNSLFFEKVLRASGPNVGFALIRAQCSGLALFFLKSFVLYCIFIPVGIAAVGFFEHLPDVFARAMSLFIKLLPLVGIALVVRKLSVKAFDKYVLAGFASAAFFGQILRARGAVVLLLTATVGWIGARYGER